MAFLGNQLRERFKETDPAILRQQEREKLGGTPSSPSAPTPESVEFLRSGVDESTRRMNQIAGLAKQDQAFEGGVQGATRLNDDPSIRRAVTARRAQTRDYRLARRQAIRRGDRLGAAAIGERAAGQGLNLHGIGRYGEDQKAASIGEFSLARSNREGLQGLIGGPQSNQPPVVGRDVADPSIQEYNNPNGDVLGPETDPNDPLSFLSLLGTPSSSTGLLGRDPQLSLIDRKRKELGLLNPLK